MGKGYKLTSASGDGRKQCAFFFSDQGCRNGANCKFSHDASQSTPTIDHKKNLLPPSVSSGSSVMSSESERDGEVIESRAGAYASLTETPDDTNPFFSVPTARTTVVTNTALSNAVDSTKANKEEEEATDKKKRKRKKRDSSSSQNIEGGGSTQCSVGVVKGASTDSTPISAASQKKLKQTTLGPVTSNSQNLSSIPIHLKQASNGPIQSISSPTDLKNASFRNLNLPIASFSLPVNTDQSAVTPTKSTPRPPTPQHEPAQPSPPLPLPTATPSHLKWQAAVIATRSHSNYMGAFNFEKVQQNEFAQGLSTPYQWITTRPFGDWCKNNPAAIAIDCEMCETTDPLTGKNDTKALCRLSVVNADNPDEVLLDTLVKPEWPVSNYRTWINGISQKNLENVQFTLRHAQMFMNALCSEQTVIIGHAVHNDLLALKMIHHCNVDTAMVFSHPPDEKDGNTSTPSLKNLAHGILRQTMPDIHDSINDARVALACAEHYRSKGGAVEPVEKVFSRSSSKGNGGSTDTSMLLVHRLPQNSKPTHISDMFLAFTSIRPKNVPDITFAGNYGKCHVEFSTEDHAELAYRTLSGEEREDKTGKKQKRVVLKNGGYVCVRKMKNT